jgi:hypothetical protein
MMTERSVQGFKINNVLDRLALDMLRLLEKFLTDDSFDRDKFHLAVLLTLSRRTYVTNLLYRDFRADPREQWHRYDLPDGGSAKIHEQGIVYLHRALARRLKLARRLRFEPGNMHLLLAALCRFGTRGGSWSKAEIRRALEQAANDRDPDFFEPLGRELAAQRQRLGDGYGDEARRRRTEYGPLWVRRGKDAAEAPEEMSIFDVIEATPVPLDQEFAADQELQRLVVRVLDALNERYTLLRSCGLDPDQWHDRDEPAIGRLREMKRLRQQAEELMRLSIEEDKVDAYRRAFAELQEDGKAYAGYRDFDDFATSEVGMAILRYPVLSLDDPVATDEAGDSWLRHETLSDPDARDAEETVTRQETAGKWVELLIEDRPAWFDPIMRFFFLEVIGGGRPIHPAPGEPGLLGDPAFQELLATDPELRDLEPGEQAELLYERADKLIKRGLRRRSVADV